MEAGGGQRLKDSRPSGRRGTWAPCREENQVRRLVERVRHSCWGPGTLDQEKLHSFLQGVVQRAYCVPALELGYMRAHQTKPPAPGILSR